MTYFGSGRGAPGSSRYWIDTLWQDVRFAFRLILRNKWVSGTIIATLTVGIAVNVSVFSLLNGFFLRPWVRSAPETFVRVIPRFSGEYALRYSDYASMSQPDYAGFRDSVKSLEALAAYRVRDLTLSGAESGSIRAALASCNTAHVMGYARALHGRGLTAGDCAPGQAAAVVVLSESLWRSRFDADESVVGRVIHVNRVPVTIVGIASTLALPGPDQNCDAWMPYTMLGMVRPSDDYFADPRAQWLTVVGRRRADHALKQVELEMRLAAKRMDQEVPGRRTTLIVTDGSLINDPEIRGRVSGIMAAALGATSLLLLLACVNVATLLLSRSAARQREIAVRLSLGAERIRLLRQLLTEGIVLSGLSTVLSLFVASRGPSAIWRSLTSSPAPFELRPDVRVLLYCLAIAVATGVAAWLSPSLEALRPAPSESLKATTIAATSGRRRSRLRPVLVAAQVALSFLLVVHVVLLAKAQRRFFTYDPGFETRQVVNVTLSSVLSGFRPADVFYEELESRVSSIPGVTHTGFAGVAPWAGRNPTPVREVDGQEIPGSGDYSRAPANRQVSPDYFATLGVELIRGRTFSRAEVLSPMDVVPTVISQAMARRYWPDQNPVGRRFRVSRVHEVVGVARDTQSLALMQNDDPLYYSPLDRRGPAPPYMLVRVSGDTEPVEAAIRDVVRQTDPQMAATIETLAARVAREGDRLTPVMAHGAIAGGLALLLALTGVYAVVSFSVVQRTREIGIRTALGAQYGEVVALIVRSTAAPTLVGLAVGLGLTLAASIVMESLLFGVNPRDPRTLGVMSLLMLAASLAATWIPARRAARLDPLTSLRHD